jgi:hypothetical protein
MAKIGEGTDGKEIMVYENEPLTLWYQDSYHNGKQRHGFYLLNSML